MRYLVTDTAGMWKAWLAWGLVMGVLGALKGDMDTTPLIFVYRGEAYIEYRN